MYCRKQFALLGVALMSAPGMNDNIATATNADILIKILNVPLLSKLGENLKELPVTGDAWSIRLGNINVFS